MSSLFSGKRTAIVLTLAVFLTIFSSPLDPVLGSRASAADSSAAAAAASPPASADPGSPTCVTDSVGNLTTSHGYASASIPAGATVSFVAAGTMKAQNIIFNFDDADYTLYRDLWIGGTDRSYINSVYDGDYDLPAEIPFSGIDLGSWTNTSTSSVQVGLDFSAYRTYGTGIDWNVALQVSGGSPGACAAVSGSSMYGPNEALGQQCPSCHGGTDYSVDSLTGNEHWTLPGAAMSSRGPGIDFELAYNSLAATTDDSIGHGWHDSYDMSLGTGSFGTEVVTEETGATVSFIPSGSAWVAPPEYDATLVHNSDGSWTFTRHHDEIFTFDSTGRLVSIADRNGYATTLTYGADGLDHVVDDAGHRLDFTWAGGRVATISDVSDPANPRTMKFTYTNGDLTEFDDIGGGAWPMTYDDAHRLTTVQSPRLAGGTSARHFDYDAQGRVDWEEDPLGRRTTLHYDDPQAGATRIVDPAGNARVDYYDDLGQRTAVTTGYDTSDASTTHYVYDQRTGMVTDRIDGRGKHWTTTYGDTTHPFSPTKTIDPLGRQRSMTYTAQGDLATVTDAHGVTTKYAYDTHGNPTSTTIAAGTPGASTISYVYGDASDPGQPTSMVDARGKTWSYDYDSTTGTLTRLTDPIGNATTWTYDPHGWVHTKVAPNGNATGADPADYTTTYDYDAYGHPTQITDPKGDQTKLTYDANGNQKTLTDASGRRTDYTWTLADQLESLTHGKDTPDARTVSYTYWPDGHIKTSSGRAGSTATMTWDSLGRLATKTDPDGSLTKYTYDPDGRLLSTTLAAGTPEASTTRTSYDDDGRIAATTAAAGTPAATMTSTVYDIPIGTAPCQTNLNTAAYCTTTTQGDHVTVRFYDDHDELVQLTRPGGKSLTYAYDAAGALKSTTDPAGTVTTNTYDDNGALKSTSNGDPDESVSYTYNPDGQRSTMTDDTGTTTYTYDRAGQLSSVTDGNGDHIGYGHDPAGRTTTLTYPDGRVVSYTYNGTGQMDTLTDHAGGQSTTFGYNADGVLRSTSLPNGDTIALSLDATDLPTETSLTDTDSNTLATIKDSYDAAGRISTQTDGGSLQAGTTDYGYNSLDQLTSATNTTTGTAASYGYDEAGNPTTLDTATQTFDDSDQLQTSTTTGSQTAYTYDDAGNRTHSGNTTYTYNAADELATATTPAGAVSYTYTGDGTRSSKTTPDGHTIHYTYNPASAVPELLTDGTTDYLYGPTGAPLASGPSSSTSSPTNYFLTDTIGSTRALTDANGQVTGTYTYSPYGQVTHHSGETTPLQYAGGYTDPETGLDYLINRYYDPTTGTFATVDPLVALTGQPYTYADDNPTNEADPTGQCPWCIAMAIGGIAGGLTDLGTQVLDNLITGCPAFNNISWGEVATSAIVGAGLEGLSAWTTSLRLSDLAANAGAELPEGYSSFSAAKLAMGSPGQGNVFDHVVEQSQIGRSGFAPEEIHNPFNMNPVSARTNQIKANYYSSKQPFTGGGTVRDWLTGQSFADQYSFGMDVLTQIRRGLIQ